MAAAARAPLDIGEGEEHKEDDGTKGARYDVDQPLLDTAQPGRHWVSGGWLRAMQLVEV